MSATDPSRNASTTSESNTLRPSTTDARREYRTPRLDVPGMTRSILENYDAHVENFVRFLRDRLGCHLVYQGPDDVRQHVLQKSVYACSVYCRPKKILKDVFPVMIGSRLDAAIRHGGARSFEEPPPPPLPSAAPFAEVDIGRGFFVVNGFLRHLPYFYTNDPTNTHVIQRKIVRVYSYNAQDRGKELNYYVADANGRRFGQVAVVHNDGSETADDPGFFSHCPHPVDLTAYASHVYREDSFDIDHLGNKTVVSPGHLFVKLFVKYLYGPLREGDWKAVKSRSQLVRGSIETGCLLHVLSRKTVYFKEGKSAGKMTRSGGSGDAHHQQYQHQQQQQQQQRLQDAYREIGANGEVFVEKSVGCYREISSQTYPLNPFVLHMIVRQISSKVNPSTLDPYHPSQEGWFCKLGVFDTKNVGRTNTMVRGAVVTTCDCLDPVYNGADGAVAPISEAFWKLLDLESEPGSKLYVVVNEACVPVSRRCHLRLDLFRIKRALGRVECYARSEFLVIRYKTGLIAKRLPGTEDFWVTPYDELYWSYYFYQIRTRSEMAERFGNEYSHVVDLNCVFPHNAFLKNILAFNSLKNAVLATTSRYAHYFADPVSAYRNAPDAEHHEPLMRPVENDGVSPHFALLLPRPVVAYMSYRGLTQEDCVAKRDAFAAFDCFRFFTLRLRVVRDAAAAAAPPAGGGTTSWIRFRPVRGDPDPNSEFLGTLVAGEPFRIENCSVHVTVEPVGRNEYDLFFNKSPFRVLQHHLVDDKLTISVEQEHRSSTGDKLCSLHGQKGVLRAVDDGQMPRLDGSVVPDLLVNPYCLVGRMTYGQILEAERFGGGRDALEVRNGGGRPMPGCRAFYGRTFYFAVVYFSREHMYAPDRWKMDKVLCQPVKGRSRQGGMKLGNMEVNALRGCGVACCFEQKFFEDGDRRMDDDVPTVALPQSTVLIPHDFAHFKCHLEYRVAPAVRPTTVPLR